jgi:flagellar hook-length control protein FliK
MRPDAAQVQPPAPVPVAEAAEALRDLIQLTRSREATHARLVLHPADLGGVEVHLRQTADGLQATVHVEHPEALQVLERGVNELRRGLEARGVHVESIDVGLAADQQERRSESRSEGFGSRTGRMTALGDAGDGADPLSPATSSTVRLSAGALVDVMA